MTWLATKIGKAVAAVVAAVSILLGVFFVGRKAQRSDDRVEDLEDYIHTKQEIDDVEVSADPDAAFERLRRNGWVR